MTEHVNRYLNQYIDGVIRWRWIVLPTSVLAILMLMTGARHLELQQNYRIFFGPGNPQLVAFDTLEAIFTKHDNHVFLVHNPEGSIFNEQALQAVHELTEGGWQTPYSTRVDSITNYQHSWAEADDLIVEDLLSFDEPLSEEAIARARDVALSEPLLTGNLVSRDEDTTLVAIRVQIPEDVASAIGDLADHSRSTLAEIRTKYPELRFELTGTGMLSNAFGEAPEVDAASVFPAMFLLLMVFMAVFLRSLGGIIATTCLIFLSALGAMGAAGYYGYGINPANMASPIVVLTLAIADSVHILMSMFKQMSRGSDKISALKESMRINASPVFLTSITTAIGFLVLNFSETPPFQELGNITATGVFLAWALSMTFMPAALAILPMRAPRERAITNSALSWLAELSIAHRGKLVLGMTALIVLATLSISRMVINDTPHEYFDKSIAFRNSTDFMIEHRGFYGFYMSLSSEEPGGVNDPEYLEVLDQFATWLRENPAVVHVSIFSDTMKRLNRNLHGDDPAYYKLPEERDMAAQYLLLYEMSLPFGLDLNDTINVDKSATRVEVTVQELGLAEIKALGIAAEQWILDNGNGVIPGHATGPPVMFAYITEDNIRAMVRGTLFGFALISIILVVSLRSISLGLISIIPNVIPAMTAFGIWALIIGQVGFAISVVAGLSIGIIVDDTVHFLSKYGRARRELNLSPEDAIRYTFNTVGQALLSTSLIVAGGFAILMLSSFRVTAYMGALTALTVVCALLADFFLLPALLLVLDRKKVVEETPEALAETA